MKTGQLFVLYKGIAEPSHKVDQVILIGDQPPNSHEEVIEKRQRNQVCVKN